MEFKLTGLSIFFYIIQLSFALKCFTCNPDSFPECNDLSNNTLQAQDCAVEMYLSREGKLLDHLGFGEKINSVNKNTLTPTCLKVASNNHKTGAKSVERLCTFKLQNEDTCAVARVKLQKFNHDVIEFCGTCDDRDGCNNGNQIKLFYSFIIFGAIVSTVRVFV